MCIIVNMLIARGIIKRDCLQDVPQDIGMMFVGISKMDCNDIVEELLKYGYVDISDYDYTNILLRTQVKIRDV
jgi:hypothetical protein